MKVIKPLLMIIILSLCSHLVVASEPIQLCQEGDTSCTFVLLSELNQDANHVNKGVISVNEGRANERLSPFSTFKVANSLIALDLGLIKNTKQELTYNKNTYPKQAWWPQVWQLPHYDLTTAFKYSMVSIYRELATSIGDKNMRSYLNKMNYGNEDISSGLDDFWLNGSMKISAVEQIRFLRKIYHNQFAFNEHAINALKEVMAVETTKNYRMFAKTGAGKIDNGAMLGWYVGFVENSAGVHYFSFNLESPGYGEMKAKRVKVAKEHLKLAGII